MGRHPGSFEDSPFWVAPPGSNMVSGFGSFHNVGLVSPRPIE